MPVRLEVIEEPRGTGQVLQGANVVLTAPYRLTVTQEIHEVKTEQVRGLTDTLGWIRADAHTLGPLLGEELVLLLEDGRKLPFYFKNADGMILARGPFEEISTR